MLITRQVEGVLTPVSRKTKVLVVGVVKVPEVVSFPLLLVVVKDPSLLKLKISLVVVKILVESSGWPFAE